MKRKILILAANPKDTPALRLDEELREIDHGLLQRAKHRDQFELEQKLAVRPRDIQRAMLDVEPQIVHFSGHGTGANGLVFEDETGQAKLVSGKALAALFQLFADKLECVVLNGCYSKEQAEVISQYIPYVIGMNKAIGDKAAIAFAVGFYDALGAGQSIEFAYRSGCVAIQMEEIPEYLTPVLFPEQPTSGTNDKKDQYTDHFQDVVSAIVDGKIVPFLGPGINLCDRPKNIMPSNWKPDGQYPPTRSELALYLEQEIVGKGKTLTGVQCPLCDPARESLPEGCPIKGEISLTRLLFQYVSQHLELRKGKGGLKDALNTICRNDYTPNLLHKFLAKLPQTLLQKGYKPPMLIVTANFDSTLELAFKNEKQPFDLVSYVDSKKCFLHQKFRKNDHRDSENLIIQDEQLIIVPNNYKGIDFDSHPVILKLYGPVDWSNNNQENFVITEDHFIDYLAQRPIGQMLPASILAKLKADHISFLGYGLSNWDERVPLRRIWSNEQKHNRPWWAVQSKPTALDKSLWEENSVKLIDMDLGDYVTNLEQLLEQL